MTPEEKTEYVQNWLDDAMGTKRVPTERDLARQPPNVILARIVRQNEEIIRMLAAIGKALSQR